MLKDIATNNFVVAKLDDVAGGRHLPPAQPYVIDLEMARKFPLGPGRQLAIDLPPSQIQKPAGIARLDPYAWDMFCTAWTLETIVRVCAISTSINQRSR